MELSIDAGTKGLLRALGAIKSSIHFLAKRKAAELAALKLVRSKLEEHVGRFMLFDLDHNRSALGTCRTRSNTTTRTRYCCPIILDNSAAVGSLPFGVNPLTTPGRTCDSCLVRSSSERPVS